MMRTCGRKGTARRRSRSGIEDRCCVASSSTAAQTYLRMADNAVEKSQCKIVILGGGGRVGSETAKALVRLREAKETDSDHDDNSSTLRLVLVGRDETRVESLLQESTELAAHAEFRLCDIDDKDMTTLQGILDGASLVINAAGPFQRRQHHHPLKAAIEVCLSLTYSLKSDIHHVFMFLYLIRTYVCQ